MTGPEYPPPYGGYVPSDPGPPATASGPPRWTVDAGRLWAGGAATAVVAALVAIVGLLVAKVLDVDTVAPFEGDTVIQTPGVRFALAAAVGALLATLVMHMLILSTPRPK